MIKFGKIFSKIIIIILTIIIGLALMVSAYFAFCKLILKQKLVFFFGVSSAIIVSDSMYPEIKKGDMVIIKVQESYETDDIISFKDPIGVVTHRIIEVTEDGYITQGDAVGNDVDRGGEPISKSDVYGKVIDIKEDAGTTIQFLTKPTTIILIFLVFGALYGAVVYLNKALTKEDENEKK